MKGSTRKDFIITVIAAAVFIVSSGVFAIAHAQLVGGTLPSVPTGVSVSAASAPGQVNVSWGASTESSGTIEGYYVYRNSVQVANTAGTSIVDVIPGSGFYNYTVAAYDATGHTSQQSSPASLTLIADTTPPTTPTGVTIAGATTTNSYYAQVPLTISWNPSTDNVAVVGYYVYRNGTSIASGTSPFTATSINDSVGPGTYTYTVAAYDAAQNQSARSAPATIVITIDTMPPSVPAQVAVQQTSANGASLSWATSTDPVGVAGYQIFRNGIQIASATAPPYSDSGLSTGSQYSYAIAAYDSAGNISGESAPLANVTIQAFNGPAAPTIIGAGFTGTSSAQLSWASGADPLAITSYTLYRDGATIVTVTSTTYIDPGLTPGVHLYNVSETDISGATSPISATSTVIVPAASAIPEPSVAPLTSPSPSPPSPSSPSPLPLSPVVTPSASSAGSSNGGVMSITQSLYYGLRNDQVSTLQALLVNDGYLNPINATGFFGNLTLGAVEKFQCDNSIACAGGVGYGIVGPKTRAALNASGAAAPAAGNSTVSSSPTSPATALAEIQTLEAELASLEAQLAK